MSASVVADLKRLAKEMKRFARLSHPTALKAMRDEAVTLVALGFDAGTSPDGKRWDPPKSRPGGQPLRASGRLMGSVTTRKATRLTKSGFRIGTNVVYAAVHQHGWPARNITARPYLPDPGDLPAGWERSLEEAADEALARLAGR